MKKSTENEEKKLKISDNQKKVLSWLEGLTFDDWHMYHSDSEVQNIAKSAMELLKEQEPKPGKWILDDEDANSWECSECGGLLLINDGTPLENDWSFCPYCGSKLEEQAVKLK